MLHFDVIFKANSSVKPLNAYSDKMIFAVSMENQTFIRYVAADGTSMILKSFDYKANFVDASLSFDFRLLHLTELVCEKGNEYYSSVIYDIQNPTIKSYPIHSSEIIRGDFEGIGKYSIIYLVRRKLSQHQIILQEDNIILSKDLINTKIKNVVWSHYSSSTDTLSVLAKYGDNFFYYNNFLNSDIFYTVKGVNEQDQNQKKIYTANFHETFCLLQQCFIDDSDHDQIQAHFFPRDKHLTINIPKISSQIQMSCIQYYPLIFAFVPNFYICIIDIKSMNFIIFNDALSKMPVSSLITVYDEGVVCDNKEGIVYSTRIDLNSFKNLSNVNEIKTIAIVGARIKCSNYFYFLPKEKKSYISNNESFENTRNYSNNIEKAKIIKSIEFNEFKYSSIFNSNQKDFSVTKMNSHYEEEEPSNQSSARNLFHNVNDDEYIDENDSDDNNIIQKKGNTLMDYDSQPKTNFKRSHSFDMSNLPKSGKYFSENPSIEYQMMFGKIIIDKIVVSNIFDLLASPFQISLFMKEFIKLNGIGSSDHPISALSIFYKRPYILPIKLPLETKKEITLIDKTFPTTGLLNRCDVFTRYFKYLMEERSLLFNDACIGSMDIIRRQNSFMLNLNDAFLAWHAKGSLFKFRKFLVTFSLYSELSFMNLPQVKQIRKLIIKYSKLYFPKTIKEMMIIFGIYEFHFSDINDSDAKYWKNRINIQSVCSSKSKPLINKKKKKKNLIKTFTIPYVRIRNQKVFRVHYYSHIP